MSSFPPLRLIAKDLEDIKVLSSCVQDAILPLKEMAYIPEEHQFALLIQRFCWELTSDNSDSPNEIRRTHSALLFSDIISYQTEGIEENIDILELLAIAAPKPTTIMLHFAGGASVTLHTASINAKLEDVGSSWIVSHIPQHKL